MSGAGTCSPVLDFKSLYSLLSDQYRIVVERAGYGFSEDFDFSREIDTVLSETRQALSLVGIPDIVSVPISMFTSNGSGGTGYDENTWRGFQQDCIDSIPSGNLIELDCPHYVHDYKYSTIAEEVSAFLENITD